MYPPPLPSATQWWPGPNETYCGSSIHQQVCSGSSIKDPKRANNHNTTHTLPYDIHIGGGGAEGGVRGEGVGEGGGGKGGFLINYPTAHYHCSNSACNTPPPHFSAYPHFTPPSPRIVASEKTGAINIFFFLWSINLNSTICRLVESLPREFNFRVHQILSIELNSIWRQQLAILFVDMSHDNNRMNEFDS